MRSEATDLEREYQVMRESLILDHKELERLILQRPDLTKRARNAFAATREGLAALELVARASGQPAPSPLAVTITRPIGWAILLAALVVLAIVGWIL